MSKILLILKRLVNLLPVFSVYAVLHWLYRNLDVPFSQIEYNGLEDAFGALIAALIINYVFFGKLTLWNREEK